MGADDGYLIVYGSQTGQAKAIAEEFYEMSINDGLSARLHCLSQAEKEFHLDRESYVIFITSTTGEGDPPETVVKFWRKIKNKTLSNNHLSHIHFTLLGLGDSNYTNFCNFGKMLNKRLEELGAKHFYESAWADDAVGLETVVEPWIEGAFKSLKERLQTSHEMERKTNVELKSHEFDLIATLEKETKDLGVREKSTEDRVSVTILMSAEHFQDSLEKKDSSAISGSELNSDVVVDGEKKKTNSIIDDTTSILTDNETNKPTTTSQNDALNTKIETSVENVSDISNTTLNAEDSHKRNPSCDETHEGGKANKMNAADARSLMNSTMSDVSLMLPLCPPRFFKLSFLDDSEIMDKSSMPFGTDDVQNCLPYPGARSALSLVTIASAKRLTNDKAVKTTLQIDLDVGGCDWLYEPGDTIGVICPNSVSEVQSLISRLGLERRANNVCMLELLADTRKKNARIPEFLPIKSTIFNLFHTCCEIRETPRKVFLRSLVEFTEDSNEKRRLQEFCSKQGSDDFAEFIRKPDLTLMDILSAFPSCKPPIEVILEHLTRLQPRAYSVASSLSKTPGRLRFVFNILNFEAIDGRCGTREGVCTGWLNEITTSLQQKRFSSDVDLKNDDAIKSNESPPKILIFLRTNRFFRLPDDLSIPIIMIGPGTGVSPFLGFLQYRSVLLTSKNSNTEYGETWLFYGCRNKKLDFLFEDELKAFVDDRVLTKLHVSCSRDPTQPSNAARYVQDNMTTFGEDLIRLIHDSDARVYVCGDAKGMAPDVYKTLKSLLQLHKGMDESTSEVYLTTMRTEKRFLEDVWV